MDVLNVFSPAAIWILFGLALIIAEFFMPGVLAVFFGAAALCVGLALALGMGLSVAWQITLFGVITVLLLLALRRRVKSWFMGDVRGSCDGDAIFAPGDTAVVVADFVDSRGEVEFRGARWQARSSDTLRAGERVFIIDNNGLLLNVSVQNTPALNPEKG